MNYFSLTLIIFALSALLVGCRNSSSTPIPDAPPPYQSFAVPQERYQSAQVYGGQSSPSPYIPPYSEHSAPSAIPSTPSYSPPVSLPPRGVFNSPNIPRYSSPKYYNPNRALSNNHDVDSSRFSLEAKSDLWALIQDESGTELNWLKMKAGDTHSIHHQGALTITCSSGHKLLVKDKSGKTIETNPNANGISIVRLPSD